MNEPSNFYLTMQINMYVLTFEVVHSYHEVKLLSFDSSFI